MREPPSSPICPAWQWPLDLDAYDRTPLLIDGEYAELAQRVDRPGAHLQKKSWGNLSRVLQPLEDALNLDVEQGSDHCCPKRECRETLRVMAMEMYRRGTPFWGWTLSQWLETAGESDASFAEKYGWTRQAGEVRARRCIPKLAYLLCPSLSPTPLLERIFSTPFARRLFGREVLEQAIAPIYRVLQSWGYHQKDMEDLSRCISYLLLQNRNPFLENLTVSSLEEVHQGCRSRIVHDMLFCVSRALKELGIVEETVHGKRAALHHAIAVKSPPEGISQEWLQWCERWRKHSTLQDPQHYYYLLRNIGRWLHDHHPEVTSPAQWTDELAAEFVRAVTECNVGQWADSHYYQSLAHVGRGKPLRPSSRMALLEAVRRFFHDCQQWGWIPLRFPVQQRYLPTT